MPVPDTAVLNPPAPSPVWNCPSVPVVVAPVEIVQVDPSVHVWPFTVVAEFASAEFGTETNLAFGNVPLVIFAAFVASVEQDAEELLRSEHANCDTVTVAPTVDCLNTCDVPPVAARLAPVPP